MDELLINASLQERNPSSLPWSIDGKEKKTENGSVDESTSPMDNGISTNTRHNQTNLKKLDEKCERKFNNSSRYVGVEPGVNLQNAKRTVALNKVNPSQAEIKDKTEEITYFGNSLLPRKDVTHSANEYSRNIPVLYTISHKIEMHGTNPATVFSSESKANTQSNRRRSPRCSLRVSRKMIQESKLGCPVPLQSERTLSKREDGISISSGSPLKREITHETKQTKQEQTNAYLQGKGRLSKNLDGVVSTCIVSLKREKQEAVTNNTDECRASDLNVDNELDALLELTADAKNYRSNKRVKEMESTNDKEHLRRTQDKDKRNIHLNSSTFKTNDCKSQNSSVSRNLALVRKINHTENCEISNGNESEPKLLQQKECDKAKYNSEASIATVEYHRDKNLDVIHGIDVKQKRPVEYMRVKELGIRYKSKVLQDIRNKMDIIDGIQVEESDREAKEPQRKKSKTKKIKKKKRQEKKEKDAVLETETKSRKTRRILRKNAKYDNKESKPISREYDVKVDMCSSVKTDSEEDIFDISPIQNNETLSDLGDDGSNTHGSYIERAADMMKPNDKNIKNNKIDASYSNVTKLIPEQTQNGSMKDKCKRSKKRKKEKVTNTIKEKDTKIVDEQNSHKKHKKGKSKKALKTSGKSKLLSAEESTERKKSDGRRLSVEPCDVTLKIMTSKVNLHVLKTDNEITHDDQPDRYKTRHRLKSSKSYTVIKHGKNTVTRTDVRVNNGCDIDYDKTSKGPENPFMRKYMNSKNVKAGNEEKGLTDDDFLNENGKQYQKMSSNTQINDDGVKSNNVAKTNECSYQGNVNNLQEMKIVDLMYDSDKDSDMISGIQYQQYLIHRPSSETSSEFEFPRPASNRTFIIDSGNEDENNSKSLHEETGCCNEQGNEEEKKLSKKQRLINFIMCCLRPKTDK